jgi:hypothetical protein
MPLARLSIPAHLVHTQALALADAVHQALVETCKVPQDDRFQLITHFAPGTMLIHPSFGGVARSADACVVEICFLRGRSDDQKRALYRAIARRAEAGGLHGDDVMVALVENGPIDWSLGRGEAYKPH